MPIFIVAVLVCFMMVVVMLQFGRGGDLRSQAQNGADAAALGAVAEIRDRALAEVTQAYLPFAGYDTSSTPAAARKYASDNDASVTSTDYGDFFGHSVAVTVKTDSTLGGIYDKLRGAKGTATAYATVEFPACNLVYTFGLHKLPVLLGTSCTGNGHHAFIPIGANPFNFIWLFHIHLIAKMPPKCGFAAMGGSGDTVQPVDNITPSSGYGQRGSEFHQGVDLPSNGLGSPIYAYADGVVVAAGPASGFGQWIVIDHIINGQKVSTVYGHMYPDGVLVHPGQHVKAGQIIGRIGSNGESTGPHVHFEYWIGGRLDGGHSVDPYPYVQSAKPSGGHGGSAEQAITGGGPSFGCLGMTGPGGPVVGGAGDAKLCASAAKAAGFSDKALVTITAIGMAESTCNPHATNANSNGSVDYGLFQVNKPTHPESVACLFDPVCNARAAYRISSGGTNFYPWCTYEAPACGGNGNASYRKYIPLAEKVVGELGSKQK